MSLQSMILSNNPEHTLQNFKQEIPAHYLTVILFPRCHSFSLNKSSTDISGPLPQCLAPYVFTLDMLERSQMCSFPGLVNKNTSRWQHKGETQASSQNM